MAGLSFSGARSIDAGVVPTPTLAFASRNFTLGAMITASHNPPEYNGIKLFNPDGSSFDSSQRQKLEAALSRPVESVSWNSMASSSSYARAAEEHLDAILSRLQSRGHLKVVVDCGCGAASLVTPHLLARMGCEVISIDCYPSGHFPRPSEPSAENLGVLRQSVITSGADLGIAHDGDADRVVAIDNMGRYVPGDKCLIILARQVNARKLIVNVDSSMVVEEQGFEVTRSRVGDAYISEQLKAGGDFGGEPSGAFIFPDLSFCPDGIYGAALLVRAAMQKPMSQWADEVPEYPIVRGAIKGRKELMPEIERKLGLLKPRSIDRTDGLRLAFADGWLLVRASGTEPKIRVTSEARTLERAEELFRQGRQAAGSIS